MIQGDPINNVRDYFLGLSLGLGGSGSAPTKRDKKHKQRYSESYPDHENKCVHVRLFNE